MYGTPADMAVSEAYLKGIRDFDVETAYKAMRQTAFVGVPEGSLFGGRRGLQDYLVLGYCPCDKVGKSVALTLDYAWSDFSLSLLARELGLNEDAAILDERAKNYENVWNPVTQFFQPRNSQGRFDDTFNPLMQTYVDLEGKVTKAYCEGSGMQWRWCVPHDPEGMIALFQSREYFVQELEDYFSKTKKRVGWWNPGPYYWHGNEPYIHQVYLFNHAGRPDLTQKWVRHILRTKHSDDYIGLDGNDDGGTLSAWYVLSALGFYPIAGTTYYELGSPLFDKAVVQMGDHTLTVTVQNNSPKNVYVQEVSLNGALLNRPGFTHADIAQGGELRFVMGDRPGR